MWQVQGLILWHPAAPVRVLSHGRGGPGELLLVGERLFVSQAPPIAVLPWPTDPARSVWSSSAMQRARWPGVVTETTLVRQLGVGHADVFTTPARAVTNHAYSTCAAGDSRLNHWLFVCRQRLPQVNVASIHRTCALVWG